MLNCWVVLGHAAHRVVHRIGYVRHVGHVKHSHVVHTPLHVASAPQIACSSVGSPFKAGLLKALGPLPKVAAIAGGVAFGLPSGSTGPVYGGGYYGSGGGGFPGGAFIAPIGTDAGYVPLLDRAPGTGAFGIPGTSISSVLTPDNSMGTLIDYGAVGTPVNYTPTENTSLNPGPIPSEVPGGNVPGGNVPGNGSGSPDTPGSGSIPGTPTGATDVPEPSSILVLAGALFLFGWKKIWLNKKQ